MSVAQSVPKDSDVFITAELGRRRAKLTDHRREKIALQDIAKLMADEPAGILPRLVDIAIELTGCESGGISLFEATPPPGVFRWHNLRGRLERFTGATTPRNYSPCGVTLDRNQPVLVQRPERAYSWLVDAGVSLPECLLVPLYIGSDEPLGTLWVVSPDVGHFDNGHARALSELASFVGIALRMVQGEEKLQRALDQQETLTREITHRVKNLFAITESMIRVTAREAETPTEMATKLSGRIHALASAHSLARRSGEEDGAPGSADLAGLVGMILKPYETTDADRFKMTGPPVSLREALANGLAMTLHELATNATKYGALSRDEGLLQVSWHVEGPTLSIVWQERGGPPLTGAPAKQGFGSLLSKATIVGQLSGSIEYDWQPSGLTVAICVPLS